MIRPRAMQAGAPRGAPNHRLGGPPRPDQLMRSEWTISVCSACGAQTEWDNEYGGPFPVRDCDGNLGCGSMQGISFKRCPGEEDVVVVRKESK